jgi:hypothetical protein
MQVPSDFAVAGWFIGGAVPGQPGPAMISGHVDTVARYPKSAFPTGAVFGPVTGPVLRLITCTGTFDRASSPQRPV